MRRARATYEGAMHHGMNRGYEGRPIFKEKTDKEVFIDLLEKVQGLTKISLYAYCIMENHYHLLFQNSSNRLADFFKQLNGRYGSYFRQRHGGRGYVFQGRYKSTLIQNEAYLMLCLAYLLNNPVKANMAKAAKEYPWSSSRYYFSGEAPIWLDTGLIEDFFGKKSELWGFVDARAGLEKLPMIKTDRGMIIGGEEFVPKALEKADRRSGRQSLKRKRLDDFFFEPVEQVFYELEQKHGIKFEDLDCTTYSGKRHRAELLIQLKDRAGLRYVDIAELDLFSDLSINSLGTMYKRAKSKLKLKL